MYLNLEPCCHYGMTPPCTDAIIEAGISKVVFSIFDPDDRVRGKGARKLKASGIKVKSGVCAGEALELNLPYVHKKLTGRTFVVLKLASTLDGRLTVSGRKWLTGIKARRYVHRLRAWTEAIAIGIGTFEKDRPKLDRRFYSSDAPSPLRIVFDSKLRFPSDHPWLMRGERVIVYGLPESDSDRRKLLEGAGAEVVAIPGREGRVDLSLCIDDISKRGITSLLIEGGGQISTSVLSRGLFERLVLIYVPLVSGSDGVSWYQHGLPPRWLSGRDLSPVHMETIDRDLLVIYDHGGMARYRETVTKEKSIVHWTG